MKQFIRNGNRKRDALRRWKIIPGVSEHAEGSALIEAGKTRVLCTASIEEKVPSFLKNTGKGWVTAEYSMLPRATHTRSCEETRGKNRRPNDGNTTYYRPISAIRLPSGRVWRTHRDSGL